MTVGSNIGPVAAGSAGPVPTPLYSRSIDDTTLPKDVCC